MLILKNNFPGIQQRHTDNYDNEDNNDNHPPLRIHDAPSVNFLKQLSGPLRGSVVVVVYPLRGCCHCSICPIAPSVEGKLEISDLNQAQC